MSKRFTVAVGIYDLSAEGLRTKSYQSPKPIFAYDTDSHKQASRILAELISGKTKRAKDVRAKQRIGHGAKFVIMAPSGDYSLQQFRRACCGQ